MQVRASVVHAGVFAALLAAFVASPISSQEGKLRVHAVPPQAYVLVDGQAMHEASRGVFNLSPGTHTIDIYNYGYKPATQKVEIASRKTNTIDVTLGPIPGMVSGPWGCITIEGAHRDAVLLNGKTPAFFVGHGDEFNNELMMKQELIVPPGKHLLTIFSGDKEVWSGTVEVPASQRVVIDIPKGVRKTIPWPRGDQLKSLPRFKAGVASATVAVAKPTAQLTASKGHINAGETTELNWTTTDASAIDISGIGQVTASGEKAVPLCESTTYNLTASGPGGTATASVPIDVNSAMQATIKASPAEARYRRIGEKVVEQPTISLDWSTANVSSVSVDPLGSVDPSGSRTVNPAPQKTTIGPVDETLTYTLKVTNCSGTSETRTATVHLKGAIEPPEEVGKLEARLALHSVFFATNQPKVENPDGGLVVSQQEILTALAADFNKYRESKPDAHLILSGHTDVRGSAESNQTLSERRVASTKQFLVARGVPDVSIETRGLGEEQELTSDQVKEMVGQNPDLGTAEREKALRELPVIVLAQNRRVDVVLSTTGEQSVRHFPFNAADAVTLLDKRTPVSVTAETKGKTN